MRLSKLVSVFALSMVVASCVGADEEELETTTVESPLTTSGLNVGEYLFPGQGPTSSQCYNRLRMQGDANLVVYKGPGSANPTWATHTTKQFIGAYAVLQRDGNFVLYNKWSAAIWATHTNYLDNARVQMQNDGNLVLYQGSKAYWASHTVEAPHAWDCSQIEASESTLVEPNTDRAGYDYKSFSTSEGFEACGTACAAEARCAAFTYVPSGVQLPTQAMCWLKEKVAPAAYSSAGMISGVKKKP